MRQLGSIPNGDPNPNHKPNLHLNPGLKPNPNRRSPSTDYVSFLRDGDLWATQVLAMTLKQALNPNPYFHSHIQPMSGECRY